MSTLVYIENIPHELATDELSLDEIRQLGQIPPDNKVFRETSGDDPDPEVPAQGRFEVHHGEKFYAVPPGTFGNRTTDEIRDLLDQYGGTVASNPDGQRYLILAHFPLGPGWTPQMSRLAIRITGYPEAILDGFLVPGMVRLASGGNPTNASLTSIGEPELWWNFSYHPAGWRVGKHGLQSYLGLVRQRFLEGR